MSVRGRGVDVTAAGTNAGAAARPARRVGAAQSATRGAILDATQALMTEEGYAAATARRVAARASVKPALVQYYFPTMDALFLEVYRRAAAAASAAEAAALASDRPLHALWALAHDAGQAGLTIELMALANHRKALRAEMAAHADGSRHAQADALAGVLARAGDRETPPLGVALLLAGAARGLVMERGLGVLAGNAEAEAIVAAWLDRVEPD